VDGLIVRQPFADLIASGRKTWELRRRPLRIPGRFYILAASKPDRSVANNKGKRLGVAVATAEQVGLVGPLSVSDLVSQIRRHCATVDQLRKYAGEGELYALRLRVRRLKQPRRYRMRPGAVTIIRNVELI
jgi:ASCH domain